MSSDPIKILSKWDHVLCTSNQMEITESDTDSFFCHKETSSKKWPIYLDVIRFWSCTYKGRTLVIYHPALNHRIQSQVCTCFFLNSYSLISFYFNISFNFCIFSLEIVEPAYENKINHLRKMVGIEKAENRRFYLFFSRALAEFFENGKICGQAAYVFNLQQRQTPSFFILSPDCPQEFRSIPR